MKKTYKLLFVDYANMSIKDDQRQKLNTMGIIIVFQHNVTQAYIVDTGVEYEEKT